MPAARMWFALGALAFAGAGVGCAPPPGAVDLDQPIPALRVAERPLQAVLHDVLEQAPRGGAVRVCRSLADVTVSLETRDPTSLGDVLRTLARQAGAELDPTARGRDREALPTFRCGDDGDYLVIGRPPPRGP